MDDSTSAPSTTENRGKEELTPVRLKGVQVLVEDAGAFVEGDADWFVDEQNVCSGI